MKNILLTLLIIIISLQFSFSQKTFDTKSDVETNIYIHTLQKYFDTIDKDIHENNKEYYIEKRHVYLDSFPNKINGFKVNWVKEVDLESIKTDFIRIMINSIKVTKDDFYIELIPFYGHLKYKKYTAWNGVYKFHYEFDSGLNGLIYSKFTNE